MPEPVSAETGNAGIAPPASALPHPPLPGPEMITSAGDFAAGSNRSILLATSKVSGPGHSAAAVALSGWRASKTKRRISAAAARARAPAPPARPGHRLRATRRYRRAQPDSRQDQWPLRQRPGLYRETAR